MEKAIKRAIKGGYEPFKTVKIDELKCELNGDYFSCQFKDKEVKGMCGTNLHRIVCDLFFWQALGKSEEWATDDAINNYKPHRMGSHSDTSGCAGDEDNCYCSIPKGWRQYWHKFIDHIAEGKDIDSFFEELLK